MLRYYECHGGTIDRTVLCWSPLIDQLFQDHDLLPITALSQLSQNDDLLHARMQTNPSSSIQSMHNGVECIGRCKRQEQSRNTPLRRRSVPADIASWLTWRCTGSLQLLRLVSHQTNELRCSNQEIDKISFQGLNPSMLDEGLLDFFSMINT